MYTQMGRLIMLLGLLFLSQAVLRIQITESVVQSNNEWTRILLKVTGGVDPYIFTYTWIPEKWKQVNNQIYLPITTFEINRKYPCRVIIKDSRDEEFRTTVVFSISKNQFQIGSQLFAYDHQFDDSFFNDGVFQGRPEMKEINNEVITFTPEKQEKSEPIPFVQPRSNQESLNLIVTTGSGLEEIVDELIPEDEPLTATSQLKRIKDMLESDSEKPITQKSIESIFAKFPDSNELDQIILERDSFLILKTIQTVVRSEEITCLQKTVYISDFFGRIISAIQMKEFTLSQLSIIIQGAEAQIQRLSQQIEFARQAMQDLTLNELRTELMEQIEQLENAYDNFNKNYGKILVQQSDLQINQNNLKFIEAQADQRRQQITVKKLDLAKSQSTIQKLELSLAQERRRRQAIDEEINKLQGELRGFEFQKILLIRRIQKIQFRIQQLNEISDRLKGAYSNIEISVERLRTDINRNFQKEEELYDQIVEMEKRMFSERNKVATRQQAMLIDFINVLRSSMPNIQEQLNIIYYECFEAESVKTEKVNGQIVYVMGIRDFETYMITTYSLSQFDTRQQGREVRLATYHILSQAWRNNYGRIFEDVTMANTLEFSFDEDFNCLNPSTLQPGEGTITSITGNTITVGTPSGFTTLKLSTCSRIESTTGLPSPGQHIYWQANQGSSGTLQVYFATCI